MSLKFRLFSLFTWAPHVLYKYIMITVLTAEVKAEIAVLAANGAGDGMFVPQLVVAPTLLPQYHLRPWTRPGSLHVQYVSRSFADDHKVLAFDPHRFTSFTQHNTHCV